MRTIVPVVSEGVTGHSFKMFLIGLKKSIESKKEIVQLIE